MSSFRRMKDGRRWLADQEELDLDVTKAKIGSSGVLFGLEYDLPPKGLRLLEFILSVGW